MQIVCAWVCVDTAVFPWKHEWMFAVGCQDRVHIMAHWSVCVPTHGGCLHTVLVHCNKTLHLVMRKSRIRLNTGNLDLIFPGSSRPFPGNNPCTQCELGTNSSYLHTLWSCPMVFWKEITTKLSVFLACDTPLTPSICLLGNLSELITTSIHLYLWLWLSQLKSRHLLSVKQWLTMAGMVNHPKTSTNHW